MYITEYSEYSEYKIVSLCDGDNIVVFFFISSSSDFEKHTAFMFGVQVIGRCVTDAFHNAVGWYTGHKELVNVINTFIWWWWYIPSAMLVYGEEILL